LGHGGLDPVTRGAPQVGDPVISTIENSIGRSQQLPAQEARQLDSSARLLQPS
jgi:hypothetical protein